MIFQSANKARKIASRKILFLDVKDEIIFVKNGFLDIFTAIYEKDKIAGKLYFLGRINPGMVAFSFAAEKNSCQNYRLLAIAGIDTEVKTTTFQPEQLIEKAELKEIEDWTKNWVTVIINNLTSNINGPILYQNLQNNTTVDIKKGSIIRSDELLWLNIPSAKADEIISKSFTLNATCLPLPVYGNLHYICNNSIKLTPVNTSKAIKKYGMEVIKSFHIFLSLNLKTFIDIKEKYTVKKIVEHNKQKQISKDTLIDHTKSIINPKTEYYFEDYVLNTESKVFETVKILCKYNGLSINNTVHKQEDFETLAGYLEAITKENNINIRQIKLKPDWWKYDGISFLAFLKDSKTACAIISKFDHFVIIDPRDKIPGRIKQADAENIFPVGYNFYPVLDKEKINLKDIISLVLTNNKKNLFLFLFMALLTAVFGLFNPIFTQQLLDKGIIFADTGLVFQLTLALLFASLSILIFDLVQSLAMLRFESKSDVLLQTAITDRLLKLPLNFFRKYSAGDLAARTMGITQIQRLLTGAHLNAILSGLFSVVSLILMIYYSVKLAMLAILMAIITSIISTIFIFVQQKYIKESLRLSGEASGIAFQLCNGLAKLKIMDRELHGFLKWSKIFKQCYSYTYRNKKISRNELISDIAISTTVKITIFGCMAWWLKGKLDVATFVAFLTAFGQFSSGIKGVVSIIGSIIPINALYNRVKPLLETAPEALGGKKSLGYLMGKIEVNDIFFRYSPDTPYILNSITMKINPGDFIALVGPSGAGKSTIMRLLLGLEIPEKGTIFFDEQDLSGLNLRELRGKIGVVSQTSQLIPGSIYDNIAGAHPYTQEEVWEAICMAGLEDDVRSFPMGLYTMVSESTETFSGGQKQRLIIAKALIKKPRILLFDEATSSLDNKTQQIITDSLRKIKATRIVIAHRLSTIQHADKIYVIDKGKIVETGNYKQLMSKDGLFSSLAKRQIV